MRTAIARPRRLSSIGARLRGLDIALVFSLFITAAHAEETQAEPPQDQCVQAYETSQLARRDGYLLRARELLNTCAAETCHPVIRDDCSRWSQEVVGEIPAVTLAAKDSEGALLSGVEIAITGQTRVLRANSGALIDLDPGLYQFEARLDGSEAVKQEVLLKAGDEPREVVFVFAKEGEAAALEVSPTSGKRLNTDWPLFVLGGVGVAGAGTMVGFGLHGRSLDRALGDCSPACNPKDVDKVRQSYLIANIGLGAAIGGFVGAAAWLLFAPRKSQDDSVSVTVAPDKGGATAFVGGHF